MKKQQRLTAADYVLQVASVWRQRDKVNLEAKKHPDAEVRCLAGNRYFRETNKLRMAVDAYMDAPDPPS